MSAVTADGGMLARRLRVLLAAIATAAVATAGWIGSRWALSGWGIAALALALVLAVPAVMILLTFAITYWQRTPPPPGLRIGLPAAVRCVIVEILSYAAVYLVLQPFPRLALPRERNRSAAGPSLVLVHGYACNAAVWAWLARRWARRGFRVSTVTLEPPFAHIDEYVAPLARVVDATAGGGRVTLVGHSMGGLVCRAYLCRQGAGEVVRLVTLGTPHHGSVLASLGYGADAEDMLPGGEWLQALARAPVAGNPVPTVSIYSVHDNFVAPQSSCVLAGAENVPLAGLGHLSLLFSRRVAGLVEARLARSSVQDSTSSTTM